MSNKKTNEPNTIINNVNPKVDDGNWTLVSDNLYKYDTLLLQDIEVKVTEDMINNAKKNATLYKEGITHKNTIEDNKNVIYNFIKVYDVNNKIQPIIKYTRCNIEDTLKTDLMFSYIEDKKTILSDVLETIYDIRYRLIACYMSNTIVTSELNVIKKKLKEMENVTKNDDKTICKLYENIMNNKIKSIAKETFSKKKYYIYEITNTEQQYVFGSYDIINNKNINKICDKYNIFVDDKLKKNVNIINEMEIYFECEGMIKVDEYIYVKDLIKKGMNRHYNIINNKYNKDKHTKEELNELNNDIYVIIQKDIMKNMNIYDEDYNKTLGYIACIENSEGDKYIFSGYKQSMKNRLEMLYMKDVDILLNNDFMSLKIYILERYINKYDLDRKEMYYDKQIGSYEKKENVKKHVNKSYYNPYWMKKK